MAALWATNRNTVLACLLCFVLGALLAAPTDREPPAVTQRSVRRLAAAVEAATTAPTTRSVTAEVDEARDVLDQVNSGAVVTIPAAPSTTATTATTVGTTTTSTTSTTSPPPPPALTPSTFLGWREPIPTTTTIPLDWKDHS